MFNFPTHVLDSKLPVTNYSSANSGQRSWHPPFFGRSLVLPGSVENVMKMCFFKLFFIGDVCCHKMFVSCGPDGQLTCPVDF